MNDPDTLIKRVIVEYNNGIEDVIEDNYVLSEIGNQLISYGTKGIVDDAKQFLNQGISPVKNITE